MRHCFASIGSTTLLTRGERPAFSSLPGQKHQKLCGQREATSNQTFRADSSRPTLRLQAAAWEAVASPQGGLVRLFQQDAGGHLGGRKVLAEVKIHASVSQVWSVLTDYERLPEFVPNLESCVQEPCGRAGRKRLRQRGCSQSLFWRLEAEAVLEVEETETGGGQREIRFNIVEGDFKDFRGRWVVEPDSSVRNATDVATVLRYEVILVPHWSIPSTIMSCVVKAGLPANLIAVAQQAEQLAAQRREAAPRFAAQALREPDTPSLPFMPRTTQASLEQLPAKGPARGLLAQLAPEPPTIRLSMPRGGGKAPKLKSAPSAETRSAYLGLTSVPIPAAVEDPNGQIAARQRARESLRATYPAFGIPHVEGVSEVHLRRLDGPGTLHRRAVAVIKINATCAEVWDVLTDYERLPEFAPNLLVSERIEPPPGAPRRIKRLRQVAVKHMMYMTLHAEAEIDLVEKQHQEIQFRQVTGDFGLLQGKFMLQAADHELRLPGAPDETLLRYAVEVQVPRDMRMLGMLEPMLERMAYEDIPVNLAALKQRVEDLRGSRQRQQRAADFEAQGDKDRAEYNRSRAHRPKPGEMMEKFDVLAAELDRCFGKSRQIPSRAELRSLARTDLEKAIRAHGGPFAVAESMGWHTSVKAKKHQRGFWDRLENLQEQLDGFIAAELLQPGVVPRPATMTEAGRPDLVRGVERWGGYKEVANLLGYEMQQHENTPGSDKWRLHVSQVAAETGLSGRTGLFEAASKTYNPTGSPPSVGAVGKTASKSPAAPQESSTATSSPSEHDSVRAEGGIVMPSRVEPEKPVSRARRKKQAPKPESIREEIDRW